MYRRILIVASALVAAGAALAQDKPATPPAPLPDPLKITVSRAYLQAIGQGLMKLPYETAAPILNDLQAQLTAADKAASDEAAAKDPGKPPAKDGK